MVKLLEDSNISNKTVLVKISADVPLDEDDIQDDTRLKACLDTINLLYSNNCKVILCGHLGRPKGHDPDLTSKLIQKRLSELLNKDVEFVDAIVGHKAKTAVEELSQPGILLLENLRFDSREKEPSESFAQELSELAEVFVNDSYPDAHNKTASNIYVPKFLPSYMGISLKREMDFVKHVIDDPGKPLVLIIGGAKKDKIGVINNMLGVADNIIVGGVLANTFLKASGVDVKGSKFDELSLEIAGEFLRDEEEKFILPQDVVVGEKFEENAEFKECPVADIPDDWLIMDIGSQTIEQYQAVVSQAKTVIWGGPIGVFEWKNFRRGTEELANFIAESDAYSLIGGGDSGDAINELGLTDKVSHVSIGGGATLNLVAGNELAAVKALK